VGTEDASVGLALGVAVAVSLVGVAPPVEVVVLGDDDDGEGEGEGDVLAVALALLAVLVLGAAEGVPSASGLPLHPPSTTTVASAAAPTTVRRDRARVTASSWISGTAIVGRRTPGGADARRRPRGAQSATWMPRTTSGTAASTKAARRAGCIRHPLGPSLPAPPSGRAGTARPPGIP
jgi:hypothetical protein